MLKSFILLRFIFLLILFIVPISSAHALNILTTNHPLYLIVSEITANLNKIDVILNAAPSHHDFNLRPTDIIKLKQCNLIFNFAFDTKITYALKKVLKKTATLDLLELEPFQEVPRLLSQRFRTDLLKDLRWDTHTWLDPDNVLFVANLVKEKLKKMDPINASVYQYNYNQFVNNILAAVKEIKISLQNTKYKPYVVTHDAYGYFENFFNLPTPLASLTDPSHHNAGGKSIQNFLTLLHSTADIRVIVDPQAPAKFLKHEKFTVCTLDPMLTSYTPYIGVYKDALINMAQKFKECLV